MDHSGHVDRSSLEKLTTIDTDIAGEEKGSLKQQPQIKARSDGLARTDGSYRRSPDDTNPKKDARGIRRLRRSLGKKAAMTESDDRPDPDLVPRFGLQSDEETLVQCNKSYSMSLTEDSHSGGGSESYIEMNKEANSSVLSSDFANVVQEVTLNDSDASRIKEKGMRRKNALQPVQAGRHIWPIQEIMSADSENHSILESDPEDDDDLVPVEIIERRRGFQLPKLRIQKRAGPRHSNDSPVARSPTQQNVAIDEGDSMLLDRTRTPTALRHRKPFGTTAATSSPVARPESIVGDDKDRESRKGMYLRMSRGRKPPNSPYAASAIAPIPLKVKVSERVAGKLRKGAVQDWKDLSGCEEYDGTSSWDDSDSVDSDRDDLTDDLRADSTVGGSRSIEYDDSVLNVEDLLSMDVCGVFPSPVKDAVKLKSRRSKDRKVLRVKPYHCFAPHKVFMTEEEIYHNMLRPTEVVDGLVSSLKPWYHIPEVELTELEKKYWGSSHDGRIGSLRVEVLSCVGISKYKSDISVYLVCGDAAFATDVIHGSRSPMWPQSSRRAACFPIFHAYARLYVGVFDVTKRKKSENDSFCGRVEIGIPSLRPDTEYDVSLPLRVSSFIYDRRPRGVVRLRLSLHWFSERAAVLSYLPAPRNISSTYRSVESPSISCADPKTFRNVAFTIHGQELPGKYTREAFQATMREFNLYQQNLRVSFPLLSLIASHASPLKLMY